MTFELPLIHQIKGRAKDIALKMTFRNNLLWPQGKFGDFWQGNWQKLLVAEFSDRINEPECPDLPKEVDHRDWINAIPRITEHNGESGTRIWANGDAISGAYAFNFGSRGGLPSGNLSGKIEIIPPDFALQHTYELVNDDCATQPPRHDVQSLGPFPIGDLDAASNRSGYSPYVPPLGVFDKMEFGCDDIRIRRSNGTVDVFTSFRVRQEHLFPVTTGEGPSTPPGAPGPDPYYDLRVQAVAVPLRTEFPNGDQIVYKYDDLGRLESILDTYNREVIRFQYRCEDSNQIAQIDTLSAGVAIQSTHFDYDDDNRIRQIITPSDPDRTWKFAYQVETLGRPSNDPRIDLPFFKLLTKVQIFSPKDQPLTPLEDENAIWPPPLGTISLMEAELTVFNESDPATLDATSKVTNLWLGDRHRATTFYDENVGGVDYTLPSGKHTSYSYVLQVCDEPYEVTVTDHHIGLTTVHTFDWMSRELSRIQTYPGQTLPPRETKFLYRPQDAPPEQGDDYYPKVRVTIRPNGNWTEQRYQFEEDDFMMRSYYTRDRFQGGNLLKRTRGHEVPTGPPFIVETWTYEPFRNQVLTYTDPRGHITTNSYDYQEGSWSTGFQSYWDFWGIDETYTGVPLNQNDLNDDETTNQRFGNLILVVHPEVVSNANTLGDEFMGASQISTEAFGYNAKGQQLWSRNGEGFFTTHAYYSEDDPDGDGQDYIATNSPDPYGYLRETTVDADAPGPPNGLIGHAPEKLKTSHEYDPIGRVICTVDPRGIESRSGYDEFNRITWKARGEINSSGQGTDLNNDNRTIFQRTEFFYDGADNLKEARELNDDPFTGVAGFHQGFVTERYGYDILDQLHLVERELIDPTDENLSSRFLQTFYHYDDNGKVLKEVSPEGRVTLYTYDPLARVTSKRHHLALETNPSSENIPAALPDDPILVFEYDKNSNLRYVRKAKTSGTTPTYHTTEIVYDEFDRRIELRLPEDMKTVHGFDAANNIISVVKHGPREETGDQGGETLSEISFLYDARNRLRETRTELFRWEKDEQDTWQRIQIEGGTVFQELAYDNRSLKIAERAHRSDGGSSVPLTIEHAFDGVGREIGTTLTPVSNPDDPSTPLSPNWTEVSYDENGNVTSEESHEFGRDENGTTLETVYEAKIFYDELDRAIKEKILPTGSGPNLPDPIETKSAYTSRGDLFKTINPNNVGSCILTDTLHRQVATEFGYNASFTAKVLESPAGINTDGLIRVETDYDDDDLIRFQRDDNQSDDDQPTNNVGTETRHDPVGRMEEILYADGTRETFLYNRDGSISKEEKFGDATSSDRLFSVDYVYDLALRKKKATFALEPANLLLEGVTEEEFFYDGLSRVIRSTAKSFVTEGITQTDFVSTVEKKYDSLSNPILDDQEVAWSYFADQSDPDPTSESMHSDIVECDFDTLGNRTRVACSGGSYDISYVFDELNRIKTINRDGIDLHRFEYLGSGQRLRVLTNSNGTKTQIGLGGYDEFRRVQRITHESGGVPFSDFEYAYDSVGNQIHEKKLQSLPKSQFYAYDKANRLLEYYEGPNVDTTDPLQQKFGMDGVGNWREHTIDNDGVETTHQHTVDELNAYQGMFDGKDLVDDKRGNLTHYDNKTLTYDARGRIVKAVIDEAGETTTHYYAFDAEGRRVIAAGWFLTHEGSREIRQEKIVDSAKVRDFVYGTGIDEICSFRKNGAEFTIHKNQIGSTMAITNGGGNVSVEYDYTPYGVVTDITGNETIGFPFLFAGRRLDSGTDLYFMRARSYHPEMGRFTTRDQIGVWGDVVNLGNPYNYVGGNPLSRIDPSGNTTLMPSSEGKLGGPEQSRGGTDPRQEEDAKQRLINIGMVVGEVRILSPREVEQRRPKTEKEIHEYLVAIGYTTEPFRPTPRTGPVPLSESGHAHPGGDLVHSLITVFGSHHGHNLIDQAEGRSGFEQVLHQVEAIVSQFTLAFGVGRAVSPSSIAGQWTRTTESMSARAAAYQSAVTGRTTEVFIRNGVKFDGIANGVLLEAKGPGYANFVRNGSFQSWFRGADGLVGQAQRQLAAAEGVPVQWHFAERAAADATRRLFKNEGVTGIQILFTP